MSTEYKLTELVFACLILNYTLNQIIEHIQKEFNYNHLQAIMKSKQTIKTMAKSDDYKAIAFCYQNGIHY